MYLGFCYYSLSASTAAENRDTQLALIVCIINVLYDLWTAVLDRCRTTNLLISNTCRLPAGAAQLPITIMFLGATCRGCATLSLRSLWHITQ